MRIGVWNLESAPNPNWPRGQRLRDLAQECAADIWLLTEVHADWVLPGYTAVTSGQRSVGPAHKRWSGIACREAFELSAIPIADPGPADEGLCLARISAETRGLPGLLVACSVLPWAITSPSWPGLHAPGDLDDFAARFRYVTDAHVDRISSLMQAGEVIIWGGDFNQSLTGRIMGSRANRATLLSALERLELTAPTAGARHRAEGASSIDHVAVPSGWLERSFVTVITRNEDARQTSDHALYLVDLAPPPSESVGHYRAFVTPT